MSSIDLLGFLLGTAQVVRESSSLGAGRGPAEEVEKFKQLEAHGPETIMGLTGGLYDEVRVIVRRAFLDQSLSEDGEPTESADTATAVALGSDSLAAALERLASEAKLMALLDDYDAGAVMAVTREVLAAEIGYTVGLAVAERAMADRLNVALANELEKQLQPAINAVRREAVRLGCKIGMDTAREIVKQKYGHDLPEMDLDDVIFSDENFDRSKISPDAIVSELRAGESEVHVSVPGKEKLSKAAMAFSPEGMRSAVPMAEAQRIVRDGGE